MSSSSQVMLKVLGSSRMLRACSSPLGRSPQSISCMLQNSRRAILFVAILAACLCRPATAQVPHSNHVFLVIEENRSFNTATANMPWLVSQGNANGFANNYTTDSAGSLLDYLWLSSGSCHAPDASDVAAGRATTDVCTPSLRPPGTNNFNCNGGGCANAITDDSIFAELDRAGITWKEYLEGLPNPGYMGGDLGSPNFYAIRHNPARWYSLVINDTNEQQKMVPFTQFNADLNAGALPAYSIIVPNLEDDAHDGTPAQADAWLKSNVAPLLNQPFFQAGGDGLLIITFDNGDNDNPGQVYTALIGPKVIPHSAPNTHYMHENTLKTILQALGITTFPGASATAMPMSDFFNSGGGGGSSGQISGIDDTFHNQWSAQTANGAGFGVANVDEASQPYTHTTDGVSLRFDLTCPNGGCSYGYTHTFNPSYSTTSATDSATTITVDLKAEMDNVGVGRSQALEFGLDQSLCTANCGTSSAQYTRYRYAMQCDFKGSGVWRVWDANQTWVPTTHNCVTFNPLEFAHFIFHFSRPDPSQDPNHVQYVDFVINGTTYTVNKQANAQSLGTTETHEFIPWVNLDGDSTTEPYSEWVDQWSVTFSGGTGGCNPNCAGGLIPTPPSNATLFADLEDKPIDGTINAPRGEWGVCTNSSCSKTAPAQMSLTHNNNVSLDGTSIDSFNSGNANWGVLNFIKNGPQDSAMNYEIQWSFMIDTDWTNVQALEFDFPASITISGQPLWFYFGTQCDRISGQWQYWNPNDSNWHNTGVACNGFTPNQWHTLRWYGNRTNTTYTYVALEIDGQQSKVNITVNAPHSPWGDDFIVQFQPDGVAAGTGYNTFVDKIDAWVW